MVLVASGPRQGWHTTPLYKGYQGWSVGCIIAVVRRCDHVTVIMRYYGPCGAIVKQDGTSALHWAAKTTLLRSVNRLLELGANVNAADKVFMLTYSLYSAVVVFYMCPSLSHFSQILLGKLLSPPLLVFSQTFFLG